jgi:hypothetical protein
VAFDNLLADSQAYATTRILPLQIKTLEDFENPLMTLRLDTNAVVTDLKPPAVSFLLTAYDLLFII